MPTPALAALVRATYRARHRSRYDRRIARAWLRRARAAAVTRRLARIGEGARS